MTLFKIVLQTIAEFAFALVIIGKREMYSEDL